MKKLLSLLLAMTIAAGLNACSPEDTSANGHPTETPEPPETPDKPDMPENPNPENPEPDDPGKPNPTAGKALIVYYSFTNNVHTIVSDLRTQIDADVIRVQPAEKGLDYAANNYAIGSALIQAIRDNPGNASSYPAIDPVKMDFGQYGTIFGSPALVEQHGGSAADISVHPRCRDGRKTNRDDRIEREQRHHRCGIRCQAVDSRRKLHDTESLDSFIPDIRLPRNDSPMAEGYRIYEVNADATTQQISEQDGAGARRLPEKTRKDNKNNVTATFFQRH